MNKKALNEKYSYQIDEYNVVHLFRGEDEYQQYLINPLLSAIFKIETIEKENAEVNIRADKYIKRTVPKLAKAREIIITMLPYMPKENIEGVYEIVNSAEEFVKSVFKNEED